MNEPTQEVQETTVDPSNALETGSNDGFADLKEGVDEGRNGASEPQNCGVETGETLADSFKNDDAPAEIEAEKITMNHILFGINQLISGFSDIRPISEDAGKVLKNLQNGAAWAEKVLADEDQIQQ